MRAIILLLAAALCCGGAHAAVPHQINYQGSLTNAGGTPVNATVPMVFSLYDDPALSVAPHLLYTETQPGVSIVNGVFNVLIGPQNAVPFSLLAFDVPYWLGVKVGTDAEMAPRQPVAASAYAIRAATSASADALATGGAVGQVLAGTGGAPAWTSVPRIAGNVVIGATTTQPFPSRLQVVAPTAKTTETLGIRGLSVTSNEATAPFALDVKIFGAPLLASRAVILQSTDWNTADGGNLLLQPQGGNVGVGLGLYTPGSTLTVAGRIETTSGGVKFPDGTTQTTAAATPASAAYKNLIVVAKSGGAYATISAALASIADNSAANPYLIYVAPGKYTETVTMKQYVDIEGAGELTTRISQAGSAGPSIGTVFGASNAELRFLTVENTGGALYAIAIVNSSASPRLTHITATASGGSTNTGISNEPGSPTMLYVTASAAGGNNKNYGVNNLNSSPTMTNVTASASGGSQNYGVHNLNSSPTMTTVTATGSGGNPSVGVYNDNSTVTMMNVTATGITPGAANGDGAGVYNYRSSMTIDSSVISASGTPTSYGIRNLNFNPGPYTVLVNNSRISGDTGSITTYAGVTTRVGASQLRGGPIDSSGGGILTCTFAYNASFVALNSLCQ